MSIWVNTLVQNEERYLWYSVVSVIEHVDKVMIWDTGSNDGTVKIIQKLKSLWPNKIDFKEVGVVNPSRFTEIRKQMLQESQCEWVMILDGDEVWWEDDIQMISDLIVKNGKKYDCVVNQYINLVGDIYHYQDASAGKYNIKNHEGFITIRFMNKAKIKDLSVEKPHGQQGFFDGNGKLIQDRDESGMFFVDKPTYLHFTNLQRSSSRNMDLKVPKRSFKLKHEIGHSFEPDFYYPESFFKPRPAGVDSVWRVMDQKFYTRSLMETPLRKIKRKLIIGNSGY